MITSFLKAATHWFATTLKTLFWPNSSSDTAQPPAQIKHVGPRLPDFSLGHGGSAHPAFHLCNIKEAGVWADVFTHLSGVPPRYYDFKTFTSFVEFSLPMLPDDPNAEPISQVNNNERWLRSSKDYAEIESELVRVLGEGNYAITPDKSIWVNDDNAVIMLKVGMMLPNKS